AGYVGVYTLANFGLVGAAQRMFAPGTEIAWADLLSRAPGAAVTTALCAAPLLHVFRRLLVEPDRDGSWPVLAAQGARPRSSTGSLRPARPRTPRSSADSLRSPCWWSACGCCS